MSGAPPFLPGRELSARFYHEAVRPILDHHVPDLVHSAALIGPGSEVLGFDSPRSTDHNWGPRLDLFLSAADRTRHGTAVERVLAGALPFDFLGWPTHFEPAPGDPRSLLPRVTRTRPVRHLVRVTDLEHYLHTQTGWGWTGEPTLLDWLLLPEPVLLGLVAGDVYHDGLDQLRPLQRRLAWYPHDLWLHLMAAQWRKLDDRLPFLGRAAEGGDSHGLYLLAAECTRALMRLAFLLERRYAPYAKWFGPAFARLEIAPQLAPWLQRVREAEGEEVGQAVGRACEIVAARHNRLGITPPVPEQVLPFHSRPYQVIPAARIARILHETIQEARVRALPAGVGKVDQIVACDALLLTPSLRRRLAVLYEEEP